MTTILRVNDPPSLIPPRQSIVPAPNNVPYIVAIVLMVALGVAGAIAVTIARPGQDKENLVIIGIVFGFIAPTTLSLLAFMKAQETHLSVNSRLDAFMRNAEMVAHVQGMAEGRAQGRTDANARTDALAATANQAFGPVPVEVVNQPLTVESVKP